MVLIELELPRHYSRRYIQTQCLLTHARLTEYRNSKGGNKRTSDDERCMVHSLA